MKYKGKVFHLFSETNSLAAGFLWVVLLTLPVPKSAGAGGIEYAALGNFEPDEGTLEAWFTPLADLYPKLDEREYRSVFQLFSLQVSGRFSFGGHWSARGERVGLHVSISHAAVRDGLLPLPTSGLQWKSGEKHHVAMTWRRRDMKLWVDGRQVSHRDQAASFEGPVGEAKLVIGHRDFRDTPIVVHAVRVSRVVRSEEDLRKGVPTADVHTLLLDRFDDEAKVDGDKRTRPKVISGLTGQPGGQIKGTYHFAKQPTPGLALFAGEKTEGK
jgi:hypothetical protein